MEKSARVGSILLGCALFAARSVGATVICVPNDAIDGSCTSGAGQPTVQKGIDAAIAADTVLVGPGTYAETVTAGHGGVVPGAPGIDIDKAIVLKSRDGAATTTISGAGGHCLPTSCPGGPQQLVTLSASGITIDGFTLLETSATVNVMTADGDAVSDNHVIKNNVLKNSVFADDVCSGGANNFNACTSDGDCTGGDTCGPAGGGWGILLGGTGIDGADNNMITGNEISLNPDATKNQFTFGIGLSGGGADSNDNNTISNNFVHDTGIAGFGDKNDTNTTVSGNTFTNNAKVCWQDFGSASGEMITGNTCTKAGRAGVEIRNGTTGAQVQNNCFTMNGASPPTFSPCNIPPCTVTPFGAIRIDDDGTPGQTTGTKIHNNNFAGNDTPFGVDDLTSASTATDMAAENNWWGCVAGPGNAGCDSVTANVDFTPFLTAPAAGTPCSPTTTTSSSSTTSTSSSSTTSTSIPGNLNVTQVRVADGGVNNGLVRLKGDFVTPPAFATPPPITLRVQDSLTLDVTHVYASCTTVGARIRCSDSVGGMFRARFGPISSNPSVYRFKASFKKITVTAPFAGPVTVTLAHDSLVVRTDMINSCRATNTGLACREP
jgi:Right handed beta helix region